MARVNQRRRNSRRRRHITTGKKIMLIFLLFVLIYIFIFSTHTLAQRYKDNHQQAAIIETIQQEIVQNRIIDEKTDFNLIDIDRLIKQNNDVIAYIEVPNTTISYPVLQTIDNSFYLERDISKNYNINGSIFMDFKNSPDFSDDNSVIFGHNMHNGNMFNPLQKIVKGNMGDEVYINITTHEYEMKYKVYSSYYNEPNIDPIRTTLDDKKAFIEETLSKSLVVFNHPTLSKDSHILTLSTCNMTGKKRTIIHAVRTIKVKRD